MSKIQVFPSDLRSPRSEVEDSEIKTSVRQRLEKFLNGYYGKLVEYVSTFLSVFSCIVYVVNTYMRASSSDPSVLSPEQMQWYEYIDIGILIFYALEYILYIIAAQHKMYLVFSTQSLIELITISPILFLNTTDPSIIMYVRIARIFRLLRVVNFVFNFHKFGETEVSQQIFKIIMTIMTLICFTAGILEVVENSYREDYIHQHQYDPDPSNQIEMTNLHEMVYFVVVTLSTVGYGDVFPESELGRVCVMLFILFALVLIPKQTNELIRLMSLQSAYARAVHKANAEIPHILISGYVSIPSLKHFCSELFHPDHGSQDKAAVILQQEIPSVEMTDFLNDHGSYLTCLQGNPMLDKDLKRAVATKARACVLLTNKYISDSYSADHKNILTGLAIKKHVHHYTGGENIRLIMQLIKPDSKTHFYSSLNVKSNDQLIVIEEIKMNLLAKSCFSPGIISMLSNLTASITDSNKEEDKDWLKEYTTGMGHEIYRTDISPKLIRGKKFVEVAAIVYNNFQGIIFALEIEVSGHTIIRLNPGSYVIPPDQEDLSVHVYMICEDKKVADEVASYEMLSEELQTHQLQKTQRHKKSDNKILDHSASTDNEELHPEDPSGYNPEDDELLESDYKMLPEPQNLMQVTRMSIEEDDKINNHIVVCGIHPSIYYFLLPLRAKYLQEYQPVVILSTEPPTNEMWDYLSRFPDLYYIKGSPLSQGDLKRAKIHAADKAVILGQDSSNTKDGSVNDEMLDAESIFIYKAIKNCNKDVQIMVDLMYSSNIEYLLQKDSKGERVPDSEFRHDLTPLFAAGEVYISSIIDTLTSQAYYNPHIVTILQQLLTGGKQSNNVTREICDKADLKQSNLWQIPVPEDYLNKTFGDLFNYLAAVRELIPLGLYRLSGSTDNTYPYVFTNPPPDTKLTQRDKVFVLAANMPNDLLEGYIDKKNKQFDPHKGGASKGPATAFTQPHTTAGSHTQISFEKEDASKFKHQDSNSVRQELNRSGDNGLRKLKKHEPMPLTTQSTGLGLGKKLPRYNHSAEHESLTQNSATVNVLDQVNSTIRMMHQEIENIRQGMEMQEEQIIEKVKIALKNEISTLGR